MQKQNSIVGTDQVASYSEIAIRNKYEEAKSKESEDPEGSIRLFEAVIKISEKHKVVKYSVPAAKHILKLLLESNNTSKTMDAMESFLSLAEDTSVEEAAENISLVIESFNYINKSQVDVIEELR